MRPFIAAILLVLLPNACQVNHFTGKKIFNAIPNSQLFPMVLAGYPPVAAVRLWERMGATSAGKTPPELLSTHPSNATRIQNLKRWIPQKN